MTYTKKLRKVMSHVGCEGAKTRWMRTEMESKTYIFICVKCRFLDYVSPLPIQPFN